MYAPEHRSLRVDEFFVLQNMLRKTRVCSLIKLGVQCYYENGICKMSSDDRTGFFLVVNEIVFLRSMLRKTRFHLILKLGTLM